MKNLQNIKHINDIYNGFGVVAGSGKTIYSSLKNIFNRDIEIIGLIHEEIKIPKKEKNKEIKSKDFGLSLI